jgi:hypothetical protein
MKNHLSRIGLVILLLFVGLIALIYYFQEFSHAAITGLLTTLGVATGFFIEKYHAKKINHDKQIRNINTFLLLLTAQYEEIYNIKNHFKKSDQALLVTKNQWNISKSDILDIIQDKNEEIYKITMDTIRLQKKYYSLLACVSDHEKLYTPLSYNPSMRDNKALKSDVKCRLDVVKNRLNLIIEYEKHLVQLNKHFKMQYPKEKILTFSKINKNSQH